MNDETAAMNRGALDYRAGIKADECPYMLEIFRAAWLVGWTEEQVYWQGVMWDDRD